MAGGIADHNESDIFDHDLSDSIVLVFKSNSVYVFEFSVVQLFAFVGYNSLKPFANLYIILGRQELELIVNLMLEVVAIVLMVIQKLKFKRRG